MKDNGKTNKKTDNNIFIIIAAIVLFIAAIGIYIVKQNSNSDNQQSDKTATVSDGGTNGSVADNKSGKDIENKGKTVISKGKSLKISVSDISSKVSFYPIKVDGVDMEIIAVKDSKGEIRTAFNTCQVCYSSGRGYYVQNDDVLICQNCGNQFTIDDIGVEAGGCNPWAILSDDRTVKNGKLVISYDYLKESEQIFSNWKEGI